MQHPLHFRRAPNQRVYALGLHFGVQVDGVGFQRIIGKIVVVVILRTRWRTQIQAARTVRKIAQQIDALDRMQLQEIRRRAVFLVQQRNQHILGQHLILRRMLHMNHRPLNHALKAHRGLRLVRSLVGGVNRRVFINAFLQLHHQQRGFHAAMLQRRIHIG